ncbi:MAG: hypothetical protein AAFY56_02190, partial [Pseudomonadota bacterium]
NSPSECRARLRRGGFVTHPGQSTYYRLIDTDSERLVGARPALPTENSRMGKLVSVDSMRRNFLLLWQ